MSHSSHFGKKASGKQVLAMILMTVLLMRGAARVHIDAATKQYFTKQLGLMEHEQSAA